MPAARRFLLPLGLMLALAGGAQAAPADPDYETLTPVPHASAPTPAVSSDPPGLATSPLAVPDHPSGPHPRMRFVMRDGTVLIGQVIAFDGQMYALWTTHSTLLVRKDFFTSVSPYRAKAGTSAGPAGPRPRHVTRGL